MRALLLVFLLALRIGAEELPIEATFHVYPAGSKVEIHQAHLNVSGATFEPISLVAQAGPAQLDITITHEGFAPLHFALDARQLQEARQWPPLGTQSLQASSALVWFSTYGPGYAPWVFLSLALVWAGYFLVVAPRQRRRQELLERAQYIEGLVVPKADFDPLLKTRLGPYRLVEFLGEGGMARVYRALPEATMDDKDAVAVKVVHAEVTRDESFSDRFWREVKLMDQLRHPAIARLESYGEEHGRFYIAVELLRGESLRSHVDPNGMSAPQAMRLLEPVMEALSFAHQNGVVHRDVKPENIMVCQDGRVKLMDFGLARSREFATVTATGSILGTPAYVAPEQILNKPIDPSMDQYSLGITLYELVSGRLPYDDGDPVQMIYKHLSEDPVPPKSFRPRLNADFSDAIMRMLAKEPESRFPDMIAVRKALRNSI